MFRNLIISLLLLIAAGLSAWSILISKQTTLLVIKNPTEHPDAIMENVIATIINKEGKPSLKIETPKMIHYAKNDTTDITTPHVTVYRQSPKPWTIDSQYAQATHGIVQINFWNHVVIHHPDDKLNPTTTMQMASLTVFPDKQIAQTDQAVVLTQPDTTIHAIGMLANLDNGTIKLISQTRTEYVPHS